jgi:acetyl esterase/lipase
MKHFNMRFTWLKRIILGIFGFLILIFLLLLIPRLLSALHPDKPPIGYHFVAPVYIAAWTGIEKIIKLDPEIPQGIKEIKDIEYKNVNGKSLQLDMYIPDSVKKQAPLLVFIHGGGWRSGKRSDYLVYLIDFAKKGYITATVSYRLLADSCYPACVEDVSDAVDWFIRNSDIYGYDPRKICLVGGSAGAHLALLTAYGWKKPGSVAAITANHRIKAVIDIYGPYDLTTPYSRTHSLVTSFLAHSFEDSPALYSQASPKEYIKPGAPPTLILHGTSDQLVPVSQSDSLASKLASLGIPYEYYRVPGWPHVMDIVKRVNIFSQKKMNAFLEKYLQ